MLRTMSTPESSAAWHELLTAFADFDKLFLEGDRAVRGETAVSEGYRWLAALLGQSLDMTLFADPVAPRFADLTTPFRQDRRLGGDNTDCYYSYAVIDPRRTYRVSGAPNDSDMYSLTVYNEPEPGAWPNKTVGLLYDQDMPLADGRFSCLLGPQRPHGYDGPFIELSEDAHGILTRDYHRNPAAGRRVDWDIDVVDHAGLPEGPDKSDDRVAAALRPRCVARRRRWRSPHSSYKSESRPNSLTDKRFRTMCSQPRTAPAAPPMAIRCRTRSTAWARSLSTPTKR